MIKLIIKAYFKTLFIVFWFITTFGFILPITISTKDDITVILGLLWLLGVFPLGLLMVLYNEIEYLFKGDKNNENP